MTVIKTADLTVVGNNTLVNFTIVVNNPARVNATDVILTDLLPEGFVFVNATEGYEQDGQKVVWYVGTLTSGETRTYWIQARSNATGNWTNSVNITCEENSTVISNTTDVEVVPIILTVNKTANITVIANNTLVDFTIVVNNTSRVSAFNVTVSDVLPNGFAFVNATEGYKLNGNEISWNFENFANASGVELWIQVRSIATGNWTNTVKVSSNENTTIVSDNETVNVVPMNLTVTKIANPESVDLYGLINFTIEVTNNAPVAATDVTITDFIDLTAFEIKGHNGTFTQDGGKLVWNVDSLDSGESFNVWIMVKALTNGTFTNTVNVTSKENKTVVNDTATFNVIPIVNLEINKTVTVGRVTYDDYVVFTITVTNNGPSNATHVLIRDIVPNGLELYSASDERFSVATGEMEIDLILPNESVEFTVTVLATAIGNWTNVVEVTSAENSTPVRSNASVNVDYVTLNVTKTANVTIVGNNTLVNFTIIIENSDDLNASHVDIIDMLPNGFVFVDASEGYFEENGVVLWYLDELATKSNVTYWIVARTNAIDNLTNEVFVVYTEGEESVYSNVTVEVVPVNLTVNKTANVETVDVNKEITFTINVTNNARVDATNVTITDVIPTGFEFVSSSDAYDNETGVLTIPIIKAGESYVFTITLKAIVNGTLTNVVNVTCGENDTVITTSVDVNITPVVNLTVVKVADIDDATIGDIITFTITVTNNGPSNATNIKVTDILDKGFTLVSGELEQVIPFLASGNSTSIVVKDRTTANGTYTNSVTVTCGENDTVKSANASVYVYNTDLKINKTATQTDVSVGELVNFTIVVKNHGKSNATNINITDVLDEAFEFVSANGTYTRNGQTIVWIIPTLTSEETYAVTVSVRVLVNGTFENVAHVNCTEEGTVKNSTSTVNAIPVVNLTVEKVANVNSTYVGENITFTINVTNRGPSNATGVVITDVVPNGFEFVESSASDYDKSTGVLNIPLIKAGESYIFTITLKAVNNGTLTNVVTVTSKENDTEVSSSINVNVTPVVKLTVVKVADSDYATIGDVITFTITVTNNGLSDATNIKVTDILDKGFTLVSGELEQVIPFLASGNSTSIVVKVRTTANGTYTNNVNVTCDQNDTVWTSNASVHVYNTDIKVNKTAEVSVVSVNDVVKFIIVVKNHGKSNATNVVINDVLDDAFEFVDANGTYARNGQTIVWTFDNIASEETATVWVSVKALTGGTFENVAHVNCSEEGTVKNSTATVEVKTPSISIVNTADDEFVYSGNQTSFTIKVTNDGEVTLTGVNVEQVMPDGLIYDHFTGSNWTYDGNKFIYNGSLGVGESVELIIVVNTTKSGKFVHNATASSNQTGRVSDDDSVLVYTPALTVREIANNPIAVVGQTVSFTVVVTNIGDCDLTGVYTVNNFPDGLIYTDYDGASWDKVSSGLLGAPVGGWTQDGNRFDYLGTLKPGESANYTLYFQTTAVGVFTPEVIANSDLTSNAYSNNTTVVVEPKLEVTQDIDKSKVNVGDNVVITVTVTNVGGCDLGDVYVIENVPEGLEYLSFSGNGWSKQGDKFIYNGTLGIGESASFEMIFKATKPGNVTNNVVAGSNMTEEVDDDVDVEIVNKTTPVPPKPTPKPTPEPVPEPTPAPVTPKHAKEATSHMTMHATGNPIILLLLVIFALMPFIRRKH